MKNQATFVFTFYLLLILGFALSSVGQGLTVESYLERTVSSPKLGLAIGYKTGNFSIGGFYQEDANALIGETSSRGVEQLFYGAFIDANIRSWDRLSLFINGRIGLVDHQGFMISPGLKVDFEPLNRVHLTGMVALRVISPSAGFGLKIDLGR